MPWACRFPDWLPILEHIRTTFPKVRRVSCYAMASNVLGKAADELNTLLRVGVDARVYWPGVGG